MHKYIKKSEFNKKMLEKKREEAELQILRYSEDERIDKNDLKRYIVIFAGCECQLIEEV